MSSYVYLKSEAGLWTVGFYEPNGKWHPESDHSSAQTAADRVAVLNGAAARPASVPPKHHAEVHSWSEPALMSIDCFYRCCRHCGAMQLALCDTGWKYVGNPEHNTPSFCRPASTGPTLTEMREMGVEP